MEILARAVRRHPFAGFIPVLILYASPLFAGRGLLFESNGGQAGTDVLFVSRSAGLQASFTRSSVNIVTPAGSAHMRFGRSAVLEGLQPAGTAINYFIGPDQRNWIKGLPSFRSIVYRDVRPGIDLVFHSEGSSLEYDVVVAPGADPTSLRLHFTGAKLRLSPEGDLLLTTPRGQIRQHRPCTYQQVDGLRKNVEGRFVLRSSNEAGFEVPSYSRSQTLVIDPSISYSSFVGGSGDEGASAAAVDSSGSLYLTGRTASLNLPGATRFGSGGATDAYIVKLNPAGTSAVYVTYLGGTKADEGRGIKVDSNGNAYVIGGTSSADFPTMNPIQMNYGGGQSDAFIAKLDPSGSLLFSTFLGGSGNDAAVSDFVTGIAVDSAGIIYVTGDTSSTNFPVVNAFQPSYGGGDHDAFVAKIDSAGRQILFSTYLGGDSSDYALNLTIDAAGNTYIAGITSSTNFPVSANAYQRFFGGGDSDAMAAKFSPTGQRIYATYLGRSGRDSARGIAVDANGDAYVVGFTTSRDFPNINAFQNQFGGGFDDGFIAKFDPAGSSVALFLILRGQRRGQHSQYRAGHGRQHTGGWTEPVPRFARRKRDPKFRGGSE